MKSITFERIIEREIGDFEYLAGIDLALVDEKRSIANQARLVVPIIQEKVDQYVQMIRRWPDTIPALVAYRWDGKYVLIDGNHRFLAAKKAGKATLDVYVVKTTDMVLIDRATRLWNRWTNGAAPKDEEVMNQAVYLVESGTCTIAAAAAQSFVSEASLRNEIVARQQRTRAERLGFDPNILGRSVLRMFSAIHNDNVLSSALKTANKHAVSVAQGNRLLELIREAGTTENRQLQAVETWTREVVPTRAAPKTEPTTDGVVQKPRADPLRNRRTTFMRNLRNVERDLTVPDGTFEKLGLTSLDDIRDVLNRVDALYLAADLLRERFEERHRIKIRETAPANREAVGSAAG